MHPSAFSPNDLCFKSSQIPVALNVVSPPIGLDDDGSLRPDQINQGLMDSAVSPFCFGLALWLAFGPKTGEIGYLDGG